jgi:hypothetical protein
MDIDIAIPKLHMVAACDDRPKTTQGMVAAEVFADELEMNAFLRGYNRFC